MALKLVYSEFSSISGLGKVLAPKIELEFPPVLFWVRSSSQLLPGYLP